MLYASPLFDPLRRYLDLLPERPDAEAVAELAKNFPIHTANGRRVSFIPPPQDGMIYECRIWESGEVATRLDNWHDFFNALVWMQFPKTKIAISAGHMRAMQAPGETRNTVRDVLTHFDECGIVVLSSQSELLDLLRQFRWKKLFVERRAEVIRCMRFIIFGHATYELALKPFRGLTGKAVLYPVAEDWLSMPMQAQLEAVDGMLATDLVSGRYTRPSDFQPLPLLGIPGATPDNENPAYYDDTWQFRPGRRGKPGAGATA